MFIRKRKIKGIAYYDICEKKDGKLRVILYLGTIEKIMQKFSS